MAVDDLVIFQNLTNYSVGDYRKDIESASPSLKARVVDIAVDAICIIHENTPAAWLSDQITNGGKIAPEHIMLDDLCRPRNQLPPPPIAPFEGGQCDEVRYRVNFTVVLRGPAINGVFPSPRSQQFDVLVWGKIQSFSLSGFTDEVSGPFRYQGYKNVLCLCRGDGGLPNPAPYQVRIIGSSSSEIQSYSIDSITRVDGQPDNCGSPPAKYPVVPIPPESLDRSVNFPITPTINAPVRVVVNPVVKFAPTVLAPVISVNVGGINVNFSLGGFTLTPTYNSPTTNNYPTSDPRINPPPTITIKPPDSFGGDDIDLSEVIERLKDIEEEVIRCCDRDAPHSPPEAGKVLSRTYLMEDSIFQSLPPRTFQVTVDILTRPDQEKVQFARIGPDVIYAGWFWFGAGNHFSSREPVDAEFKVYSPPDRITDSFACKLYKGYTARVVAYYINPNEPEEQTV